MMNGVFGDLFERVVVINLARRPERMAAARAQLDRLGVRFERFEAVDGSDPAIAAAWRRYLAEPLAEPVSGREITTYKQFYLGDFPNRSRQAFVEARDGKKALWSAGAWGLLLSMTGVVERAVKEGWKSVLILEDDVLFHRDTAERLPRIAADLPPDWLIFQLGAMQLHWEEDWITWRTERLYRCEGSSLGAHAVGLRAEVLPELLSACYRRDLPYDIGALQTVKRKHRARCYTAYPHLAIQEPSDSDIGMSKIFFKAAQSEENVYRWRWSEYGVAKMLPWGKRRTADAPATPAPATASEQSTPAPARRRKSSRADHLHPVLVADADAPRVIVLLNGLSADTAAPFLSALTRQRDQGVLAPIALTDDPALFLTLRDAKIPFEHLPSAQAYARWADSFDAEVYRLRRLMLIRKKWRPARVLAFGDAARALLEEWRASPFEPRGMADDLDDLLLEK